MSKWIRGWGMTLLAWVAVLFIGGAAIAGVGARSDHANSNATVHAPATETPEVEESEEPDANTQENTQDNHGACVSHWAHESELEGHDFGAFISEVAQGDGTGADCEAPTVAETTATTHGKSGETHGQAAEHKPANPGSQAEIAGSQAENAGS